LDDVVTDDEGSLGDNLVTSLWDLDGAAASKVVGVAGVSAKVHGAVKKMRVGTAERDEKAIKLQALYRGHASRKNQLAVVAMPKPTASTPAVAPRQGSMWSGGLGSLTDKPARRILTLQDVKEFSWDDRSRRAIVMGALREHTLLGAIAAFLFGDGAKLPTAAQAGQLLWSTVLGLLYLVCMQIRFSWLAGANVHTMANEGASLSERMPRLVGVALVAGLISWPCVLIGRFLFLMANKQKLVYNNAHGIHQVASDTKAALSNAFAGTIALRNSLDADGDGKVSAAEMYAGARAAANKAKARAMERAARLRKMKEDLRASLDTDGDGKVSYAEMAAGMRRLRQEIKAQTKSAFQERRERLKKMREELRASLDTDGDGKVSAAEFAAGMRRLRKEAAARAREKYGQATANPLFSSTVAFVSVWAIAIVIFITLAIGSVRASTSMEQRVVKQDVIIAWWLAMILQWLVLEPFVLVLLLTIDLLLKSCTTFDAQGGKVFRGSTHAK